MQGEPCEVCNGTELNLKDGFYYCMECGTQNTNVQETVVEEKTLGDGNFGIATRRKIVKQFNETQMSGEWYKWHAFNFIILGLADELVAAGAKPSFKLKLLWIWTRYIKKYQNKEEFGLAKNPADGNVENMTFPSFMVEENSTSNPIPDEESEPEIDETAKKPFKKNVIVDGSRRDIKFLSRGVIIAMLYLALNLDESDIQLSHLLRFIKEKHLNFSNITRFLPKDINVKSIQNEWIPFINSKVCNMHHVRKLGMSLLRKLDLGTPKVPNLRKIVDNILTELCLPNDIKPLIYSLMHFNRCDFMDMSNKTKDHLIKIPDYEGIVMSYVLVAMKMCFGLDGDYEEKLSDAVDKINNERNFPKSHKLGKYSEPSTRLFSFKEWCSYMQYRKITLCKSCLLMAEQHYLDIDDYVYMEHVGEMPQNNKTLQDETAIDLINRIPAEEEGRVIPKHLFLPTLIPMSEYTEIIMEYSQDPEMLSEDFTQYSLKYACEHLELVDKNAENIIRGVSEDGKFTNKLILGTIVTKKCKTDMVYVKNCENKNWMTTKPPTIEHVTCDERDDTSKEKERDRNVSDAKESDQNISIDKESDHGYDSENPVSEKEKEVPQVIQITVEEIDDNDQIVKEDQRPVIITEEDNEINIFDDAFEELDIKDEIEQNQLEDLNNEDQPLQNNAINEDRGSISDASDYGFQSAPFNPDTFDREQTIKELILNACKKNKIPIPSEYKTKVKVPRKRKNNVFGNEDGPSEPRKRSKTNRLDNKKKVDELLSSYYCHMQSDLLSRMQNEVSLAIQNTRFDSLVNAAQNESANPTNVEPASDALSVGSLSSAGNIENLSIVDPQSSVVQQNENDKEQNYENNKEQNDENEVIDENFESKLFENEEDMKIDDLIKKGDPKFDDQKYDAEQLYLNTKEEEETIFDINDPKLEEIIKKKIEENKDSAEFENLKAEPSVPTVKTNYESDSEDDIPLNVIQEERKMIEEMLTWEENFEPLINKDELPEFKYWFRHYDKDFMTRSQDWHKKFDEELKENTPSSFFFVIKECASILNSSTFNLYKHMQNLESYIIAKAK